MSVGSWPSLDIVRLGDSLAAVVKLVDKPHREQSDEATSALARFLVIRACGYLEQVTEEACRAFMHANATPQVGHFGASWLGHGANPTPENLLRLVGRFDTTWADELRAVLCAEDELLWRELSLLVDRRNKMAHGLSEGTGSRKALDLAQRARTVAEWFIGRFDPRAQT